MVDDYRRYIESGKSRHRGGISSGLDEALYIVSLLYGVETARRGQLSVQYHPQLLLHCGDPADADIPDNPGVVQEIMQNLAGGSIPRAGGDVLGSSAAPPKG